MNGVPRFTTVRFGPCREHAFASFERTAWAGLAWQLERHRVAIFVGQIVAFSTESQLLTNNRPVGEAIAVRAPAKINWTLRILGKRPDGFHELESLVSPVSLFDELLFSPREEPGVALACDAPDVPVDDRNLIVRAGRLLAHAAEIRQGAHCRLTKRIPVGGGLGGGSSNAASTLLALNRLWKLDWPIDRLAGLAAELGSDVPLFLCGGPAIMRGRGERIEPANLPWQGWVVLVCPRVPVSTAEVYKAWRPADVAGRQVHDAREWDAQGGAASCPSETADSPADARSASGAPESLELNCLMAAPSDAVEWMERTFNMLERPAMEVCPVLNDLMNQLTPLAGRPVRVSGSGSTLFTAFDEVSEARHFAEAVSCRIGLGAILVRPIAHGESCLSGEEDKGEGHLGEVTTVH